MVLWKTFSRLLLIIFQIYDLHKSIITCQPIPRLRIDGGTGVALAYLDTAMKAPVDYNRIKEEEGETIN